MKITVSAPGKLMLLGEHAVVYGHPCIVTAMDTRMRVSVSVNGDKTNTINAPQVKECRFVQESIKLFCKKFNLHQHIKIHTAGDFSHQVGLGSSSAVTVATVKALSDLFDKKLTTKEIFDLSYQVTIAIQGVGSGFDIAAAVCGGTIYYIYGGKTIEQLQTDLLPLVVGYSGVKADTPTLIRQVAADYKNRKKEIDGLFTNITKLVEYAKRAIIEKDYRQLGSLMSQNHGYLKQLGVSTDKLNAMVQAALNAGAYGAKLSGAGGGDCMIALVSDEKRKAVEKAIEKAGGEIIRVKNSAEGVKIENKRSKKNNK